MQAIEAFFTTASGPLGQRGSLLYGIPVIALGFMLLEFLHGRLRHRRTYDAGETLATLVISIGQRLVTGLTVGLVAIPFAWAYEQRAFDAPLDGVGAWALLFLGVEFCYYWHHRAMHRVRWFWANHAVHHSATRFNLSAALRLGWVGQLGGGFLFYLPLVFLGFPPLAVVGMLGLGLAYQFFLHLEAAPSLGPLEWVLNTPTHHRVHHAANDACLDRNYGSVLIVFDRLFGSFAAAPAEPLVFGLKGAAGPSRNPFAVVLAGWRDIARRLSAARTWRQGWSALFGAP